MNKAHATLLASVDDALPTILDRLYEPPSPEQAVAISASSAREQISQGEPLQCFLDTADDFLRSDIATTSDLAQGSVPATQNVYAVSTPIKVCMAALVYLIQPLAIALQTKYPERVRYALGLETAAAGFVWVTFSFKVGNSWDSENVKTIRAIKFVHAKSIEVKQNGHVHGIGIGEEAGIQGESYAVCDWHSMVFCFAGDNAGSRGKCAVVPSNMMRKAMLGHLITVFEEWKALRSTLMKERAA